MTWQLTIQGDEDLTAEQERALCENFSQLNFGVEVTLVNFVGQHVTGDPASLDQDQPDIPEQPEP